MRLRNLLILLAVLVSTSCAKMADSEAPAPPAMATKAEESVSSSLAKESPNAQFGGEQQSGEQTERLIIRNANLTVVSDSPTEQVAIIQGITQTLGGFIVSSSSYGSGDHASTDLTIRVPADGFEQAMKQFRGLGEVDSETISGQDVTEEFVDIQARLKVQRSLEGRYIGLLAESNTIADTLAVENELARVRQEIERMEGRTKYLRDQASMATIQLHMRPEATASNSAFSEIGEAFEDSGEIIIAVIAGTIRVAAALLPIALMLTIFGFVAIRLFSRIRKRRA